MGAQKWTTLHRYNASTKAVDALRERGYRIVATTPHHKEHTLANFDITKPAALFFGAEAKGLSDQLLAEADDFIYIPTFWVYPKPQYLGLCGHHYTRAHAPAERF